jgi:RNA polymerase sigma-70 factor, ECF subfamily
MDDAQLDELFASCMPRLRRIARQILRNPEDSEDALQEGLLLAFRNLRQFQGRSKFSSWLHTIVKNAARTHVRRMKSRPQLCSEEEFANRSELTLAELSVDPGPSPEDECVRQERSGILLDVLQDMPAKYQAVVHLCDVDGIQPKAAAQRLGITSCALKTYLFRARRLATRRIRARVFPSDKVFPRSKHACHRQPSIAGANRAAVSIRGAMRKEWERYPMRARERKKLDRIGGNDEPRRKRPRLWNRNLSASAFLTLHNALLPTR